MSSALSTSIRLVSRSEAHENSSTEFRARRGMTWSGLAAAARRISSENGEVAFLTMGSPRAGDDGKVQTSPTWMTERNESVSARIIPIRNPNGKDKLISAGELLLKIPNTLEITLSADEWRQQSVAADGQVMDRGAERAAGGCDAI